MKVLHVFTLMCTARFFDGQFKFLSDNGYEMHLACSPEAASDFIAKNGLKYHPLDIVRRVDVMADIRAIRQLTKLIKKEKFDAVFGHTPKGAMVAMIASFLANVKCRVYYRHGIIYVTASGLRRFIFKSVERLTGWLATNIVNVAPSLSALAANDHLNSVKHQTVIGSGTCCGLDTTDIFNPKLVSTSQRIGLRERLGIHEGALVFGFVGRLCKEKGIREIVDAFLLFKEKHQNVKTSLLLIGGYDERDVLPENYKSIIREEKEIISTKSIAYKELPKYYSIMDAFVFPSYREGLGLSVIEASAMGVPVLVSRSHGCVDAVRENVTGIYIDISKEGVLEGMEKMMDADLRHKLGQGGIKFAQSEFEIKDYWSKVLDYYKRLI